MAITFERIIYLPLVFYLKSLYRLFFFVFFPLFCFALLRFALCPTNPVSSSLFLYCIDVEMLRCMFFFLWRIKEEVNWLIWYPPHTISISIISSHLLLSYLYMLLVSSCSVQSCLFLYFRMIPLVPLINRQIWIYVLHVLNSKCLPLLKPLLLALTSIKCPNQHSNYSI